MSNLGFPQLRHPDNGITKFTYDNASNLIAKETANLLAENNAEKIEYFYTFNRLDSIVYPKYPHNNVHFFYGQAQDASAVDDFSVGRLWYQIDATGVQQFKYGRLGEVRYNLRSVAVPGDKAYWFKTEWEYDTWNRVKKIIYPDEEEVSYFYNRGGELHAITSKKQEQQNEDIISQLGYDKFGQRTYLRYGNGTETEYSYEAERRRLQNMTAKSNTTYGSSVNRTFINNNYSYDILSNVLSVENTAALPTTGQIGGSVLYEYGYDDLNRLEKATALFTGRNAQDSGYEQQQYSLTMEYDNLHNIVSKEQLHQKAPGQTGGIFTDIPLTTYKLDYSYDVNDKPHAPRTIVDKPYANSTGNDIKTKTYNYDANGNMISLTQKTGESDAVEKLRTNLWDEENRLRAVDITPDAEGVRPIAIYTYDAGGERILKHSNTSVSIYLNGKKVADTIQVNATLYPSGITVFRPSLGGEGEGAYTKHYFAGTQRVSSKIGTTENLGDYLYDWFTQGTGGPVDVIGSSFGVLENAEEGVIQVYDEFDIEPPAYDSNPVFIPVQSFTHGGNEVEQYFFHPDHLGSTSYITNLLGEVSQHIEYFAFGETFVEEHRSSNNSPYKFNGKELDEETGLYYYGARYYDPRISVWLSVDPPMVDGEYLDKETYFEKNNSVYSFSWNNPVRYIDPKGDTIRISFRDGFLGIFGKKVNLRYNQDNGTFVNNDGSAYNGKLSGFYQSKLEDLNRINRDPDGFGVIELLNASRFDIRIKRGNNTAGPGRNRNEYAIGLSAHAGINIEGVGSNGENLWTPSWIIMGHEFGHALDAVTGCVNCSDLWYGNNIYNTEKTGVYLENKLRTNAGLNLRRYYSKGGPELIDRGNNPVFSIFNNRLQHNINRGKAIRIRRVLGPFINALFRF